MSLDGAVDRREDPHANGNSNGNGTVPLPRLANHRLRLHPNTEHKPERYDDMKLEFNPYLYTSLEQYLPPSMLTVSREVKLNYMREILARYLPETERTRVQRHKEYRQSIMSSYKPLHIELYTMDSTTFFLPSFLAAINENTEDSLKSIMSEPCPGVYTFEMLQPYFCEMLLAEVENFETWVKESKFRIMRPNTMNKFGAVLDDFGLETMLDKLMEDCIRPISKVLFPDVGGSTLDSHHGFVVEYGKDRDVDLVLGRLFAVLSNLSPPSGFHVWSRLPFQWMGNVVLVLLIPGIPNLFADVLRPKLVDISTLPNPGMEYLVEDSMMAIDRTMGNSVQVAESTFQGYTGFYASILVEIDLAKPISNQILIEGEDSDFWQDVSVGSTPKFCNHCKVIGHLVYERREVTKGYEGG
ncbi:hypothetical protein GIB67_022461 [Kingdonia uniflora]|uniref:Uncharacterized protein n=1 Tax=Kingdonia uniflora TaxID=39325 RepID=A0A7J7MTX9_9MAGN|nr:hypothetical protein GIB67_022461 [Kingdonia uniflora]